MGIKKLRKNEKLKFAIEIFWFIVGSFIFSLGISVFITPGNISVGGFTGISIIINHILKFPIGILIIIMNLPMFIICIKIFGFRFIIKTVVGVVVSSLLIDFLKIIPAFDIQPELNALFGGVLQGIGLGLLYLNGFTTGGTDLILWLLKLKFPNLTSGFILFMLDAIVISIAAILFQDPQSILYSAIAIFSYTKVLDTILGSSDKANLALIVSSEHEKVADKIAQTLERSVTVLNGKGWYSKEDKTIIMCVVDRSQIYTLKKVVIEIDSRAFFILSDAKEVIGEGFKIFSK